MCVCVCVWGGGGGGGLLNSMVNGGTIDSVANFWKGESTEI